MARGFTRIEFENDVVIVVKVPKIGGEQLVQGNRALGWDDFIAPKNVSHTDLVDELIAEVGTKVERKLSYLNLH